MTSATPPLVRAEGLTERIGDIQLSCTGTPGNTINANISIGLNTNLTNRLSSGNTLTGIVFTVEQRLRAAAGFDAASTVQSYHIDL